MYPKTTLDPRYSDPTSVAVSWERTCELLGAAELFWICTVRADGRPHVTPLVAVWVDEALHFHTGAEEQKFVNLRTNQHVVLLTGCNAWDRGVDVVIEGDAVQVTDNAVLTRLARAWECKWDRRWHLTPRDGGFGNLESNGFRSEVFSVKPSKVYAHAKGDPFGQTRHRFRWAAGEQP